MEYTQAELLQIYQRAYTHTVLSLIRESMVRERVDLLLELTEFAHNIAADPNGEKTQRVARSQVEFMEDIHKEMMDGLEQGDWMYPCTCLHEAIHARYLELENCVNAVKEEDENLPENDVLFEKYNRWMDWDMRCKNDF